MSSNKKSTSTQIGSLAAETLQTPNSSSIAKELAGSALSQVNKDNQTGSEREIKAAKVLAGPKYNDDTKVLAASISQSNKSRSTPSKGFAQKTSTKAQVFDLAFCKKIPKGTAAYRGQRHSWSLEPSSRFSCRGCRKKQHLTNAFFLEYLCHVAIRQNRDVRIYIVL